MSSQEAAGSIRPPPTSLVIKHPFPAGTDAYCNSKSTSWLYPLYDVHGNVKATLTRSGATGYRTANWKSYDVWGGERSSTGSGSMFGYGGNLGHPTDPENGLIYMRARFYEPWTGRFLSEDPAKDGLNWYNYCWNDPVNFQDKSGQRRTNKELWRWGNDLKGNYENVYIGLGLFTAAFASKSAIAITYAASCLAFFGTMVRRRCCKWHSWYIRRFVGGERDGFFRLPVWHYGPECCKFKSESS